MSKIKWLKIEEKIQGIKKCPFCGFDAQVNSYIKNFYVKCTKCGASIYGKSAQEVLNKWNERPEANINPLVKGVIK